MKPGTTVHSTRDAYWQAVVLKAGANVSVRWTRGALAGRDALVPREFLREVK